MARKPRGTQSTDAGTSQEHLAEMKTGLHKYELYTQVSDRTR